ncbi:MAG: tetratricopeptide repeat protein [Phycisphaerae bacterium]|jgi:tetratricopeptide (TPR) repeat protein|nr:tetratricopeptide repeat protein [Phycisphaerae bacterium]MCZ2400768.1 tetratricopeptide repeat protein [Phycisphaerae bacterium]
MRGGLTAVDEPGLVAGERTGGDSAPAPAQGSASSAQAGPANPIENYRQQRMAAAMRGLRYESGRAEIDTSLSDLPAHDAAEAALSHGRGLDFYSRNMFVEAIGEFTRAVLQDPDAAQPYSDLALALVAKGRMNEALAAYASALDRDPSAVETRMRRAMAFEMADRSHEAIDEWSAVLEHDASNLAAHGRLAILYYYAGRYSEAWAHVHAVEALGGAVPPQFRPLLAAHMPEPAN